MADTPIYTLGLWAGAQAQPWVKHDANLRLIEALIRGSVLDRDLTAPPGACADGAAYLVKAAATGAWTGHAGQLAVAVGTNASNGWIFAAIATDGHILWVEDEELRLEYVGGVWGEMAGGGGSSAAAVATEAGTTYDLLAADAGKYIRFTSASAKAVTVQADATEALPANGEWHMRNVGAGDLTLVQDTGVTIIPPNGGTLVVPEGGTVTLKRVAEDEFDLLGQTVAV